jgi:hypothetical protein
MFRYEQRPISKNHQPRGQLTQTTTNNSCRQAGRHAQHKAMRSTQKSDNDQPCTPGSARQRARKQLTTDVHLTADVWTLQKHPTMTQHRLQVLTDQALVLTPGLPWLPASTRRACRLGTSGCDPATAATTDAASTSVSCIVSAAHMAQLALTEKTVFRHSDEPGTRHAVRTGI